MFKIHMQLRPLLVRRSRKLLVVASDAGRTHAKKGLLPNHLHMRSMRGFQSFDELTFKFDKCVILVTAIVQSNAHVEHQRRTDVSDLLRSLCACTHPGVRPFFLRSVHPIVACNKFKCAFV